ncbi:MAG TPA: hypothetical protein PKH10_03410 [bacterium]|nr:hypothetical protein [bacterium]
MKVQGWVFVVSNPSAPELSRISFSVKQPATRVEELNRTKDGLPFVLEYEVIVDHPQRYKELACRELTAAGKHEWKEWFRCSPVEAAMVIRKVIGEHGIVAESLKRLEKTGRDEVAFPDRETMESVRPETVAPEEASRKDEDRARSEREKLHEELEKARQELAAQEKRPDEGPAVKELNIEVSSDIPERGFPWDYVALLVADTGCIYIAFSATGLFTAVLAALLAVGLSALLAYLIWSYHEETKKRDATKK